MKHYFGMNITMVRKIVLVDTPSLSLPLLALQEILFSYRFLMVISFGHSNEVGKKYTVST